MSPREDLEITLVRRAAPPVPPLSEAGRHAVRERLREAAGRRRRRRRVLAIALPAATALAVAAVVVAAFVVVPAVRDDGPVTGKKAFVPATASAARLLRAAEQVRAAERKGTGLPIPRPEQYLYQRDLLWETPANGGKKLVFPNESWISVDHRKKSLVAERHNVMVAPGRKDPYQTWPPTDYEGLRKLPTDPDKLIQAAVRPHWLRERGPVPPLEKMTPRDVDDVYIFLRALLRTTGRTPPGLRPAGLEALARIRGVRVDTKANDILDRPAISITRKMSRRFGGDLWLLLDSRSYAFLGYQQVNGPIRHRYALVEWGVTDRLKRRPARLFRP